MYSKQHKARSVKKKLDIYNKIDSLTSFENCVRVPLALTSSDGEENEHLLDTNDYINKIENDDTFCEISHRPNDNFQTETVEPLLNTSEDCTVFSKTDRLTARKQFKNIIVKHQITHTASNDILKFIKNNFDSSFPADVRTLLQTPGKCQFRKVGEGNYHHFPILDSLLAIVAQIEIRDEFYFKELCSSGLYLKVNCDGIPLHKSSSSQFWPICAQICNSKFEICTIMCSPFLIGLYYGNEKPNNVDEYLADFIEDILNIQNSKLFYKDY